MDTSSLKELVLDLHLHSKYSRAVSSRMNIPNMYVWARKKGINIMTTSDFTHPLWFREITSNLEEVQEGVYELKQKDTIKNENSRFFEKPFLGPYYILSCEVSSIYTENGVSHRIHNLIFAPNLETVEKINKEFKRLGFNLSSDGRPIFGVTSKQLCEILFGIDKKITVIPCHVWTPWFSLYGSRSGYDSIFDCFGEYSKYIFAIETGLSSDPAMNWRIKELESRSIVSFSDAHSLEKMGREATVLVSNTNNNLINQTDITYSNLLNGFLRGHERIFKIGYTIEFYPEEGKYHFTGHRNCQISFSPSQTKENGETCPVCGKPLTVGVMHRVDELAKNATEQNFTYETDEKNVVWVKDPLQKRPKYVSLVPLFEILSEALHSGVSTSTVITMYDSLVIRFGSEHEVLFRAELDLIKEVGGARVADGIMRVRNRNIKIVPGYDGEYGKVRIWNEENEKIKEEKDQMGFSF